MKLEDKIELAYTAWLECASFYGYNEEPDSLKEKDFKASIIYKRIIADDKEEYFVI